MIDKSRGNDHLYWILFDFNGIALLVGPVCLGIWRIFFFLYLYPVV